MKRIVITMIMLVVLLSWSCDRDEHMPTMATRSNNISLTSIPISLTADISNANSMRGFTIDSKVIDNSSGEKSAKINYVSGTWNNDATHKPNAIFIVKNDDDNSIVWAKSLGDSEYEYNIANTSIIFHCKLEYNKSIKNKESLIVYVFDHDISYKINDNNDGSYSVNIDFPSLEKDVNDKNSYLLKPANKEYQKLIYKSDAIKLSNISTTNNLSKEKITIDKVELKPIGILLLFDLHNVLSSGLQLPNYKLRFKTNGFSFDGVSIKCPNDEVTQTPTYKYLSSDDREPYNDPSSGDLGKKAGLLDFIDIILEDENNNRMIDIRGNGRSSIYAMYVMPTTSKLIDGTRTYNTLKVVNPFHLLGINSSEDLFSPDKYFDFYAKNQHYVSMTFDVPISSKNIPPKHSGGSGGSGSSGSSGSGYNNGNGYNSGSSGGNPNNGGGTDPGNEGGDPTGGSNPPDGGVTPGSGDGGSTDSGVCVWDQRQEYPNPYNALTFIADWNIAPKVGPYGDFDYSNRNETSALFNSYEFIALFRDNWPFLRCMYHMPTASELLSIFPYMVNDVFYSKKGAWPSKTQEVHGLVSFFAPRGVIEDKRDNLVVSEVKIGNAVLKNTRSYYETILENGIYVTYAIRFVGGILVKDKDGKEVNQPLDRISRYTSLWRYFIGSRGLMDSTKMLFVDAVALSPGTKAIKTEGTLEFDYGDGMYDFKNNLFFDYLLGIKHAFRKMFPLSGYSYWIPVAKDVGKVGVYWGLNNFAPDIDKYPYQIGGRYVLYIDEKEAYLSRWIPAVPAQGTRMAVRPFINPELAVEPIDP